MGLPRRKAYARTKTNGQSQNCFSHPDTKFCGLGREKWRKERYERSNNLHCSNPNQYHSIQSHSDLYRLPLQSCFLIHRQPAGGYGQFWPAIPFYADAWRICARRKKQRIFPAFPRYPLPGLQQNNRRMGVPKIFTSVA